MSTKEDNNLYLIVHDSNKTNNWQSDPCKFYQIKPYKYENNQEHAAGKICYFCQEIKKELPLNLTYQQNETTIHIQIAHNSSKTKNL